MGKGEEERRTMVSRMDLKGKRKKKGLQYSSNEKREEGAAGGKCILVGGGERRASFSSHRGNLTTSPFYKGKGWYLNLQSGVRLRGRRKVPTTLSKDGGFFFHGKGKNPWAPRVIAGEFYIFCNIKKTPYIACWSDKGKGKKKMAR